MIRTFHPQRPGDLVFDLSNVTSAFYGFMLQTFAEKHGVAELDDVSRRFFYRLGREKSQATAAQSAGSFTFSGDARDVVTILISAIYNASPEYHFHVTQYDAEFAEVHLSGVDRYYRIATQLGIVQHLTWPTLHPFFEGINDALSLGCTVESCLVEVGQHAALRSRYQIRKTRQA